MVPYTPCPLLYVVHRCVGVHYDPLHENMLSHRDYNPGWNRVEESDWEEIGMKMTMKMKMTVKMTC